jgi:chromosome partitioning protein
VTPTFDDQPALEGRPGEVESPGQVEHVDSRPPPPPSAWTSAPAPSPDPGPDPGPDPAPEPDLVLPDPPAPAPDRAIPPSAIDGPSDVAATEQIVEVGVAASHVRDLPRVIAVANQKGGVGKTTTAVNLGACLAELGFRTLVIDLDPQGNASTGLGINPRTLEASMYDVLLHDVPLEDCIEGSSVRNLFVAPASLDLAGAEIELVPAFSRELKLRNAINEVLADYDYVLIDCPPSLGLLTVNAMAAATEVLVPIQCEYYALEGLSQLLRNVELVQKNLNPQLEVSAIVLVMYDARTKLSDQVATEVRSHFGDKVCRNVVPRTVRLSEAPSFGQPINTFDPSSRGAIAYRELAKEVSGGTAQRIG